MSEMVTLAARAACRQSAKQGAWGTVRYEDGPELEAYVEKNWEWWQGAARAVLETMRSPTEGMQSATLDRGSPREGWEESSPLTVWQRMIDEALK